MKQELSAGAVIVKNTAKVWEVLLIRDMKGILTFPKGLIEAGEQAKETAMREAREETGITDLKYLADLPDVTYFYTRDGVSIQKKVQYFLFVSGSEGKLIPQTDEGITEIVWTPIEKALVCVGYEKSNKPVLAAANVYIQQTQKETRI